MKSPDQVAFKAILIVSMIIAVAMLPFVARADDSTKKGPPAFSDFDLNGDGYVSEEEFNTVKAARMKARAEAGKPMKGAATAPTFSDLDTDGDGRLSEDELIAGQKAHRKAMHARHGKGGGHGMRQGQYHGKGMKMPTFDDLDLDGDGCINSDEFAKHQAERHGAQKADSD